MRDDLNQCRSESNPRCVTLFLTWFFTSHSSLPSAMNLSTLFRCSSASLMYTSSSFVNLCVRKVWVETGSEWPVVLGLFSRGPWRVPSYAPFDNSRLDCELSLGRRCVAHRLWDVRCVVMMCKGSRGIAGEQHARMILQATLDFYDDTRGGGRRGTKWLPPPAHLCHARHIWSRIESLHRKEAYLDTFTMGR